MSVFHREFRDTLITRLNPLTKLLAALALTTCALVFRSPGALGILALVVGVTMVLGRDRLGVAGMLYLGLPPLIVACGNYLLGQSPAEAMKFGLRMAILFAGAPICALTTRPADLTRSLTRLRIPSGIVISVLLVWRFLPVLTEQISEVREASLLRGAPRAAPLRRLFRASVLPLVFASVEYADRLGLALELRGFDPGATRTWYRVPRFAAPDVAFTFAIALVIAIAAAWEYGVAAA